MAVGRLAVETCALHVRLDSDLLITAALVHDLGKVREFTYGAEIGLTEEGRLLGHVELGMRMVDERAILVAVQHPGEVDGATAEKPASRFPYRGDKGPRPSVIQAYRA